MGFVSIVLEGRYLRVVVLPTGETVVRADEGPPGDDAVFERIDLAHGRVALRVADGRCLSRHLTHPEDGADPGAAEGALHLVDELGPCAAFEELPSPDGTVSLRACDLRFVGFHSSGAVVADRVTDGSWERVRYVEAAPPPIVPPQAGSTGRVTTLAAVV